MNRLWWLLLGCIGALESCGYVGPVLPPSPLLPQTITDLTAVQRGDRIVIAFSTPARTTDNLSVKQFSEIDLRVGVSPRPFDYNAWAAAATRYEVEPPPPGDPDNPVPIALSKEIPAAPLLGRRVAVAVRTAVRKKDHYSAWSNRVTLDVRPPIPPPVVTAHSTARGVLLTWPAEKDVSLYRVFRKTIADQGPVPIGSSTSSEYLDISSQYGTPYDYSVIAARENAESLPSEPAHIVTKDIFPPSVPTGLTALAAPNSIELSWQRSPETDLRGYHVFRSADGGPYALLSGPSGKLISLPSFSDHQVERGKTYRYAVSAVDQIGNASERSAPVEVRY